MTVSDRHFGKPKPPQSLRLGGKNGRYSEYNQDGLPIKVALPTQNNAEYTYTYDSINRVTFLAQSLNSSIDEEICTEYAYVTGQSGDKTGLVSSVMYNIYDDLGFHSSVNPSLSYTYDNNGNIKTIKQANVLKASYTYDGLNQLTREDNKWLDKTIVYTYDNGGNILSKKYYAYTTGALGTLLDTVAYTYDTVWKDKLLTY